MSLDTSLDSYTKLLETENKIQLLEPFKGAKAHHKMRCMVCEHIWEATPVSKRQTLKKNGVSGCPACSETSKQTAYAAHRAEVIARLRERGIEILDKEYDGRLRLNYKGKVGDEKILVKNHNCGHTFSISPTNLIRRETVCTVCGIAERSANLTQNSKDRAAAIAQKKQGNLIVTP